MPSEDDEDEVDEDEDAEEDVADNAADANGDILDGNDQAAVTDGGGFHVKSQRAPNKTS